MADQDKTFSEALFCAPAGLHVLSKAMHSCCAGLWDASVCLNPFVFFGYPQGMQNKRLGEKNMVSFSYDMQVSSFRISARITQRVKVKNL